MILYTHMGNELYRVLALDLGDKYIGIALSDITRTIATGLETLNRKALNEDIKYIVNLINQKEVKIIVIGLPINMDGTSGDRVEKTYEFANALKQFTDVKIDFLDERLTTVAAEKLLISADVSRQKRKGVIDKLAATIILQDYLNTKKAQI